MIQINWSVIPEPERTEWRELIRDSNEKEGRLAELLKRIQELEDETQAINARFPRNTNPGNLALEGHIHGHIAHPGGGGSFPPVVSHDDLTELTDDDHSQYFLLAGRSGGQSGHGGTAASDILTLKGTSHGTPTTSRVRVSDYFEVNDGFLIAQSQNLTLSGNTDNLAIFDSITVLRLTSSAGNVNLTGIAPGSVTGGRVLIVINVDATDTITLKNLVTSSAANQFRLSADVDLAPDRSIPLWYDVNDTKWRPWTLPGFTAASAPSTAPYLTFGLDAALSGEFSVSETDESTLTSGTDIHFKWSQAASTSVFKVSNIGAIGSGKVLIEGASAGILGLRVVGDTNDRTSLSPGSINFGPGNAGTDASINRTAANELTVASGDLMRFAGGATLNTTQTLRFRDDDDSHQTTIVGGAQSADIALTLPTAAPAEDAVLGSTSAGALRWDTRATTEIVDVAATEDAGTSDTHPRGDHRHAHGTGYNAASTAVDGHVELATTAETTTGTDTARVPPVSALPLQIQDAKWVYAVDAGGDDTYAITLAPAPVAYADGQIFSFKSSTANTGACTLNVNGLGAKAVKKNHDADLADNDIEAGQIVEVRYAGTEDVFQMTSHLGNASAGGGGTRINDADDDTFVETEDSADEDIIRFGTAGTERMQIDASGRIDLASSIELSADITPTAVGTAQIDYAPTGIGTASIIRLEATHATTSIIRSLAGAAGPTAATDGRMITIENINTTLGLPLRFNHEDIADTTPVDGSADCTAAMRFSLPRNANLSLEAREAATFVYDSTISRWRLYSLARPDYHQYKWFITQADSSTYLVTGNALGGLHVSGAYPETASRIIIGAEVEPGTSGTIAVEVQFNSGEDYDTESWTTIDSNTMTRGSTSRGFVEASTFTNAAIGARKLLRCNITSITAAGTPAGWQNLSVILETSS